MKKELVILAIAIGAMMGCQQATNDTPAAAGTTAQIVVTPLNNGLQLSVVTGSPKAMTAYKAGDRAAAAAATVISWATDDADFEIGSWEQPRDADLVAALAKTSGKKGLLNISTNLITPILAADVSLTATLSDKTKVKGKVTIAPIALVGGTWAAPGSDSTRFPYTNQTLKFSNAGELNSGTLVDFMHLNDAGIAAVDAQIAAGTTAATLGYNSSDYTMSLTLDWIVIDGVVTAKNPLGTDSALSAKISFPDESTCICDIYPESGGGLVGSIRMTR